MSAVSEGRHAVRGAAHVDEEEALLRHLIA